MQKRGMLLIACALFFLLLAINVDGFEVTYEYKNETGKKVNDVSLFIYNCTNDQCTSIAESYWNNATFTPESSITISNTTPVANWSLEFHFAECYAVKTPNRNLTEYLTIQLPFTIKFIKAPSCNSTVNITSIQAK